MAPATLTNADELARNRRFGSGIENTGPRSSAVSWGAIAAGAAAAASLSLILLILGVGFGLSSVSPWAWDGVSASTFGASTIVWLTLTQLLASAMGGYLAGRLCTKWADVPTDQGHRMTTSRIVSKSATTPKAKPAPKEDIAMLKAEHVAVGQVFADDEKTRSVPKRKALVADICSSLCLHEKIDGAEPDGEKYDAKVKVLSEYVKHLVKEEQNQMFPKAKASSLDMTDLGARMAARKDELMAQTA